MKRRLVPALEAVAILLVVALGAVWPSAYSIVAIAVLPAFFIAAIWAIQPTILAPRDLRDPRRGFRGYVHVSAILSAASVLFQAGWLVVAHSAPVDIIVAERGPRIVRVVFNVENGEPPEERDGRRVFRIPSSGVLLTRGRPNGGWWRPDERRFFVSEHGTTAPISGFVGGGGTATVGGRCAATYEEYIIERRPELQHGDALPFQGAASWSLECRDNRLTRR